MIEISRGDEIGEQARRPITEVLVQGFADDFAYFSTDPSTLVDAFEHMLLLERFYVALLDGQPAAVASVTTQDQECFSPRAAELRRHLGAMHGTISHVVVRSQFLGAPPEARPGLAEIGFVTTAPRCQGRGVATALIRQILTLDQYDTFVLRDIKDTNTAALGLYTKLGFTEYQRRPVRFARRAGFGSYVSMRLAIPRNR